MSESDQPPSLFETGLATDRLSFSGTGREYFRIWIVNLALSIATLGIYSAWAKVRRTQYFYRNTRLAGAGFDYHGNPIAILKGRIVAAILFGLYSLSGYAGPRVLLATIVGIGGLMPFLLARSFRFRAQNSSYRGIRFKFDGSVTSAYWVFLALPLLSLMSLFLLAPFWHQRMRRYQHSHSVYGQTRFAFDAPVGEFYVAYLAGAATAMVAFIGAGVTMGIVMAILLRTLGRIGDFQSVLVICFMAAYLLAIFGVQAVSTCFIQRAVWKHTRLGGHSFAYNLKVPRLFWINVTNAVATIVTLGFYRPFAQVRLARYLASVFTVTAGAVEEFVAGADQAVGAVGAEAVEFFDFDIAL